MRCFRPFLLGCALSLALPSAFADQALVESLQRERLTAYRLMTQFHRMTLEEGSPSSKAAMQKASAEFSENTKTLVALANAQGLSDWAAELQQLAPRFQQLAEANRIAEDGHLDFHTINDLASSGHELIAHLETQQVNQTGQPDSQVNPLLEQAVLMQRITAEYVRSSAAVDGGSAIYDSAQDYEQAVDQLASAFSQDLLKLDNQFSDSAEVSQRLDSVEVTWRFIEKPLMNYQEKAVPLLVNRYNERIVSLLAK